MSTDSSTNIKTVAPDGFVKVEKAAEFLSLSVATLNKDRVQKLLNIPFYRVGRVIRYSIRDLIAWMETQRET